MAGSHMKLAPVTDMTNPSMLAVALGASVAGALLVALVFLVVSHAQFHHAEFHDSMHSAHGQLGAIPFPSVAGTSEPKFYAEMAKVNAHMHRNMAIAPSGDV